MVLAVKRAKATNKLFTGFFFKRTEVITNNTVQVITNNIVQACYP